MVKCNGKIANDCWKCGKYFSSHSEHYDTTYDKRVTEITCGIGGHRVFNEEGKIIYSSE
jgi:hypothetical protein